MPSPPGDGVIGELVLERHIDRAGQVALAIGLPPVRFAELPAHVEDRDRPARVEMLGKFLGCDQHLATRTHRSALPSSPRRLR